MSNTCIGQICVQSKPHLGIHVYSTQCYAARALHAAGTVLGNGQCHLLLEQANMMKVFANAAATAGNVGTAPIPGSE
jgi:hypothetical protein